jgi:hypothetical protein
MERDAEIYLDNSMGSLMLARAAAVVARLRPEYASMRCWVVPMLDGVPVGISGKEGTSILFVVGANTCDTTDGSGMAGVGPFVADTVEYFPTQNAKQKKPYGTYILNVQILIFLSQPTVAKRFSVGLNSVKLTVNLLGLARRRGVINPPMSSCPFNINRWAWFLSQNITVLS